MTEKPSDFRFLFLFPALFVLIWSTGWIVAKFAAPYAEPLSFLVVRFGLAGLLLFLFCITIHARWPSFQQSVHAVFSGIFLHAIYLGGIWWVLDQEMPSSLSGLLAALQPLLTAILAFSWLGDRLSTRQWIGIVLGLLGLFAALSPRLFRDFGGLEGAGVASNWWMLVTINLIAMVSVTIGTIYQKRFLQAGDLRTITTLQYLGAFLTILPVALLLETFSFDYSLAFFGALAWSVFGLSFGAIGLLLILIRYGEVSRAAALLYLVPPAIAVESYFLFGEKLGRVELVGMGFAVVGVYLVSRKVKPRIEGDR